MFHVPLFDIAGYPRQVIFGSITDGDAQQRPERVVVPDIQQDEHEIVRGGRIQWSLQVPQHFTLDDVTVRVVEEDIIGFHLGNDKYVGLRREADVEIGTVSFDGFGQICREI